MLAGLRVPRCALQESLCCEPLGWARRGGERIARSPSGGRVGLRGGHDRPSRFCLCFIHIECSPTDRGCDLDLPAFVGPLRVRNRGAGGTRTHQPRTRRASPCEGGGEVASYSRMNSKKAWSSSGTGSDTELLSMERTRSASEANAFADCDSGANSTMVLRSRSAVMIKGSRGM